MYVKAANGAEQVLERNPTVEERTERQAIYKNHLEAQAAW
jgi:hypothetical protein